MRRFPPYPVRPHKSGQARLSIARKAHYLGQHGSPESWQEYQRLLNLWNQHGAAAFASNGHTAASPTVAVLVGEFLQWSKLHQAAETHGFYLSHTRAVVADVGDALAADLRPYHVTRLVDGKLSTGTWKVGTAFNAKRAVFRVFSWAAGEGRIPSNPLAGMKRPQPPPRPRALTDEEHRVMMRASRADFRRLLLALRLTGARPKELRELLWTDYRGDRFVLSRHKTSSLDRKRRDRVIYLAPVMAKLVAWLWQRRPGGAITPGKIAGKWPAAIQDVPEPLKIDTAERDDFAKESFVFLTDAGKPWTRSGMYQRIRRLKKRCGLAADVISYLYRHQFITRGLVNGVSPAALAELAGNSVDMISRVYSHLADERTHLAAEMERAARTPPRPKAG